MRWKSYLKHKSQGLRMFKRGTILEGLKETVFHSKIARVVPVQSHTVNCR
jgi:hypothetical protein